MDWVLIIAFYGLCFWAALYPIEWLWNHWPWKRK
jgi:hypothetical protein